MKLLFYAGTDIGRKYSNNEDYFVVPQMNSRKAASRKENIFILCDGIGGANAGEVASQLTSKWLEKDLSLLLKKPNRLINTLIKKRAPQHEEDNLPENISNFILEIHNRIKALSEEHEQYVGMGTTLVSAVFLNTKVLVHSVGDSRCYRLRNGNLDQLTDDQSEVWELFKMGAISKDEILNHPRNNVITEAIGISKELKINRYNYQCQIDDLYLLCSDGLTDMLNDTQIRDLMLKGRDVKEIGKSLIKIANEAGGKDNITLILIKVIGM